MGRHLVPDRDAEHGKKAKWMMGGHHNTVRYDYSGPGFEAQLAASLQRTGLGYVMRDCFFAVVSQNKQ